MPVLTAEALKKALPAFSLCEDASLDEFAPKCQLLKVSPRHTLVNAGVVGPPALFVHSGLLGVWTEGQHLEPCLTGLVSHQRIWLSAWLPWASSFFELRPLVDSEVISAPLTDVLRLFVRSPAWALWAASELHREGQDYQRHRARLVTVPLEELLLEFWWRVSSPQQDGSRSFKGKIAQEKVAEYLGVSRAEVNRKTLVLEKAGYLERGSKLTVVKPDARFLLAGLSSTSSTRFSAVQYQELAAQLSPRQFEF